MGITRCLGNRDLFKVEKYPCSAGPQSVFESGFTNNNSSTGLPADALDMLREEASRHKAADAKKSYLGQAVSTLTSLWHQSNSSLANVEALDTKIQDALSKGDSGTAQTLALSARQLVEKDQQAMANDGTATKLGTGMLKTAGLFMPGRAGYAVSAFAFAADQATPEQTAGMQALSVGLGFAKGAALKGSFDLLGQQSKLDIAGKAVTMGVSSRLADHVFTFDTYIDHQTGRFSAYTGMRNTLAETFAPSALVSDVVTFGMAHGALGQLDKATGGALTKDSFLSTIATGGVFGLSSGSVEELTRQRNAHESFDLSKVIEQALVRGATDAIAAAPGGKMAARASERASLNEMIANSPKSRTLSDTSSEFQLVNQGVPLAELMGRSKDSYALTMVRPVLPSGELGPAQRLLVQHVDKTTPLIDWLAQKADVIATCNPSLLAPEMRAKHVMTSGQEQLWLTQLGGRVRFSVMQDGGISGAQPVALGSPTVSDLLLDPRKYPILDRMRDLHDVNALGNAMLHYREPARRIMGGGADSIVIELANRNILKITDKPWVDEWGHREVSTPKGNYLIDAKIEGQPQSIDAGDKEATYFVQQRGQSPVRFDHVQQFDNMIEADGRYRFWDNDGREWGASQLGYVPLKFGKRGIVLLDYDAVRPPHLVAKQDQRSWWPNRYIDGEEIEWFK